jgi:DNA replication protein DnaC
LLDNFVYAIALIFKDPMTTAAAIDRLVHHSVILELNIDSYRMEQAKRKKND